jgi:tRNA pseudouridine55 synthase
MAAGYTIEQAVTLDQVQAGDYTLLPTDSLFQSDPAFVLPSIRQERLCRNGNPVTARGLLEGTRYRVYSQEGEFLSLSWYRDGKLVSEKNFFGGA